MQAKSISTFFVLIALAAGAPLASAQTSLAVSAYGVFSGASNGNGTEQSPANSAGGIFELRHISNPILGFEATYSFNRADEKYSSGYACPPIPAGGTCVPTSSQSIRADAHEITADWTPSVHIANFRPFGVLGVGLLLNVPSSGQSSASTSTKPVYVYGAGLDWGLLPHLGLRFQYRGNLYQAPDVSTLYTSTGAFTHTAEPMIGVYFNL
ncbi:MAG TPA: outer membrane beta-barrel protein [Acidobacteriaceae bacterium]|jgi:opacity protein-like surface antigen|nr:outer membrane beta-barrel protein [Acidobacteriaceae bacterium]